MSFRKTTAALAFPLLIAAAGPTFAGPAATVEDLSWMTGTWAAQFGPDTVLDLVDRLPEAGAQRICIHGRTLRQRYAGVADWDTIAEAVQRSTVPVIANGDVVDAKSAAACFERTAAAGVMIGRGAIGRPQVFGEIRVGANSSLKLRRTVGIQGDLGSSTRLNDQRGKYHLYDDQETAD
ncbi:MAG: tRNA-dihydrouridine synthase family protein [Gammaproteobacteria bacterium]|nr:tRNA-dihydrouridine synthase family protein [Gammaproteobacteria bacterium]